MSHLQIFKYGNSLFLKNSLPIRTQSRLTQPAFHFINPFQNFNHRLNHIIARKPTPTVNSREQLGIQIANQWNRYSRDERRSSYQGSAHVTDSGNSSLLLGGAISLGGLAGLFAAYNWYFEDEVPLSGRKRVLDVSIEYEMTMAEQVYNQVITQHGDEILPQDHPTVQQIKRIGLQIVKSSGLSNLENLNWEFIVIESEKANAFVLPGGKVCVFTGLLPVVKDDEGIAVVLSHEIAHILARHAAEHWSIARLWMYSNTLLRQFGLDSAADAIVRRVTQCKFSRDCEHEADHIGLLLLGKAGFDVTKAVDVWRNMKEHHAESLEFQLEGSHPSIDARIQAIINLIPEALKEKDMATRL